MAGDAQCALEHAERSKKALQVERKQRAAHDELLARVGKVQRNAWPQWVSEFRKCDPKGSGHVNALQLRRALRALVGPIGDGDFSRLAKRLQRELGTGHFDYRARVPTAAHGEHWREGGLRLRREYRRKWKVKNATSVKFSLSTSNAYDECNCCEGSHILQKKIR